MGVTGGRSEAVVPFWEPPVSGKLEIVKEPEVHTAVIKQLM